MASLVSGEDFSVDSFNRQAYCATVRPNSGQSGSLKSSSWLTETVISKSSNQNGAFVAFRLFSALGICGLLL